MSPNTAEWAEKTAEKYDKAFPVLADHDNQAAEAFGLKYDVDDKTIESLRDFLDTELKTYNGVDAWQLPVPATYIIDTDGIIRWAYAQEDYRQRPDGKKLLSVIDNLDL